MTDSNKHIDHEKFFSKVEIPYTKTKEDIWNKLSEEIDAKVKKHAPKILRGRKRTLWYTAAAAVVLIFAMAGFMRFYSIEINSPKGQHISAVLPDGSSVNLNAETSLSYHPYWWRFSRKLKLEGEAYFEVKKGKTFSVDSKFGTTQVLGTQFNIFARETYKVYCVIGKVKVTSHNGESGILNPNQSVFVSIKGMSDIKTEENIDQAFAWIKNEFIFTGVPLKEVFEDLGRQFDVTIEVDNSVSGSYTGNFKRGSSVEPILDIICKPFGLKAVKTSSARFIILKE